MQVALTILLAFIGLAQGSLPLSEFFRYGTTAGDTAVNVTDQFSNAALLDWYSAQPISSALPSFRIFGADLGRSAFINFNGHITFGGNVNAYDPFTVNNTAANILAIFNVYYSDNDLRRASGQLFHRVTTDAVDLNKANTLIRARGFTSFSSSYCIVATWINLKYYISDAAQRGNPLWQQENSYQEILCTDGVDGHVIYQYNKIEWTRSQDQSTNHATVGWVVKAATDASGLRYWVAPFSGTSQINQMTVGSNVGTAGQWMRSQAVVGPCVGRVNGAYSVNCTHYQFCCNEFVDKVASCPTGTSYHQTLNMCIDNREYNCGATNFCQGRTDGNYANTATVRVDDFYRCRSGITRVLLCPTGHTFGTSVRCS